MNNLVIDTGNSFSKLAVFQKKELVEQVKIQDIQLSAILPFFEKYSIDRSILSVVAGIPEDCINYLEKHSRFTSFSFRTPLQIHNQYHTRETLGTDRLAAVAGANELFPGRNILVIDCGTCITYDFIDTGKNYWGGAISPGLQMRFQALHTFTTNLPLLRFNQQDVPLTGNSTESSIRSGVINGAVHELKATIESYRNKYENLQVILCGGDSIFFDTHLKSSIFVEPDLVLIGLNTIVNQQNESNKKTADD